MVGALKTENTNIFLYERLGIYYKLGASLMAFPKLVKRTKCILLQLCIFLQIDLCHLIFYEKVLTHISTYYVEDESAIDTM